jgi:hypothetical protein
MAITTTQSNNNGQSQMAVFKHVDTATTAAVTVYPGFRPSYVRFENVTDRITMEWFAGMNQGDYLKTIADGTKTLETDDVLTVEVDEGSQASITLSAVGTNDVNIIVATA